MMNPDTAAKILALILGAIGGFILLQLGVVHGQEHIGKNPNHWYPPNCCSQRDCEPIPIDGVTERSDGGWEVHYVSERFGPIDEIIIKSQVRTSKDGGFHGCWRLNPETKPRTICFFVPFNS